MKSRSYTYLIGWSKLEKYYYGCRYSEKMIEPELDLWNVYFTSSKIVPLFREQFGEPDIIQIRKKFKDKKDAILWETRVLKKLNVCNNNKWLNISDNAGGINPPPSHKQSIWINNTSINKRIKTHDLNKYLTLGWKRGRILGEVKFYEHGNRKRNTNNGRFI